MKTMKMTRKMTSKLWLMLLLVDVGLEQTRWSSSGTRGAAMW